MLIDVLRLKNCRGFKEVNLNLKPLTLLLGPNNSGKSTICKMLVALGKLHKEAKANPSLEFADENSLDLGSYHDLVSFGDQGSRIIVGLGVPSGYVEFGFGGGIESDKSMVPGTELTYLNIFNRRDVVTSNKDILSDSDINLEMSKQVAWDVVEPVLEQGYGELFERNAVDTWIGPRKQQYELSIEGLRLKRILALSDQTANVEYPRRLFNEISTVLSRISYLRPDRESPRRLYSRYVENGKLAIGPRGEGAAWYLHENWTSHITTYKYPEPTSDLEKAKEQIDSLSKKTPDVNERLCDALSFWLSRLGLIAHIETALPKTNHASEILSSDPNIGISLRGKVSPNAPLKDLTDVGFGVSQVLPVLIAGLATPVDGLFVVEQPEAELHPLPQAELADFFCSMVKCGQSVLVETHSEEIFHRLRLRASQDANLARKIAVYFIDAAGEDENGVFRCKLPHQISLEEGSEFRWPDGFLPNGIEIEQQIRAARIAKEKDRA